MADKKETSPLDDIMEAVRGHDHIEVEDEDGKVWKFGFDRALVRKMEHDGFDISEATSGLSGSSLTGIEDFYRKLVWPAFHKYQPKATEDEFFSVIAALPDKEEFISYMTALYLQPLTAITANPTHSRAKFRLV